MNRHEALIYPDYSNSILNVMSAVSKNFGVTSSHASLPDLDVVLKKGYRNVVVMVFDGMGSHNLMETLPKESFLRMHMQREIVSVFPPTTTAATTTFESGLSPAEHGWIGWNLRFPEIPYSVNVLVNTDEDGEPAAEYHIAKRYLPYRTLVDKVRENGYGAESISPFGTIEVHDLDDLMEQVRLQCQGKGRHYLYTYWFEPDYSMHYTGTKSPETLDWMDRIEDAVSRLSQELSDTLLIITADHGHMDSDNVDIHDYADIMDTLRWVPSIEPRTLAFYVKEGRKEEFEALFIKYFSEDFLLYSREEILSNGFFGPGTPHPRFEGFLGDYVAIATGDRSIFTSKRKCKDFVGMHAGLTKKEMMVPLILVECGPTGLDAAGVREYTTD